MDNIEYYVQPYDTFKCVKTPTLDTKDIERYKRGNVELGLKFRREREENGFKKYTFVMNRNPPYKWEQNWYPVDVVYDFSISSDELQRIKYVSIQFNEAESNLTSNFENFPWFSENNPLILSAVPYHEILVNVYCSDSINYNNLKLHAEAEFLSLKLRNVLAGKVYNFSGLTLNDGTDVVNVIKVVKMEK
jgi:hypothetical protein